MAIKVVATAKVSIEKAWQAWTTPADIKEWNTASPDWHTTHAEVDLKAGGKFLSRMDAKDGSMGFDFEGIYTSIEEHRMIAYSLGDGRKVCIEFTPVDGGVKIEETFDPDTENPLDIQAQGWQAILDNFVKYVEAK